MAKEYFPHDLNARNDPKLSKLRKEMGLEGIGIYWSLVEILYEQGGYISHGAFESIAYDLHLKDVKKLEAVLTKFDLFNRSGEKFYSKSANRRIKHRKDVSKKRSEAGKKGKEKQEESKLAIVRQLPNDVQALNSSVVNSSIVNSSVVDVKEKERVVDVREVNGESQHPLRAENNKTEKRPINDLVTDALQGKVIATRAKGGSP